MPNTRASDGSRLRTTRKNPGSRGPKPGSRTKSFPAWLKAMAPAGLKIETADGDEKIVKVRKGTAGTVKWKELVETVEACGAVKVEALTDKDETVGVWEMPEAPATGEPDGHGYDPAEEDTGDERLLKTFAHLLADAHKLANEGLARVVGIQAQHFAEERKALSTTLLSMDRAMSRMQRISHSTRTRI